MHKVMIVDDEAIAREYIRHRFPWEEWGFEIAGEATNGLEALQSCEKLNPLIVLIDITMPVMDGFSLLERIDREYPNIKCIILTSHRDFNFAQTAIQKGALGYILKSSNQLNEVKAVLDKAVRESRKETSLQKGLSVLNHYQYPLRRDFFEHLLTSVYNDHHEIIQQAEQIGVMLDHSQFILVVCEVEGITELHAKYPRKDYSLIEFSMLEIVRETLIQTIPNQFELFPIHLGRFSILLKGGEALTDLDDVTMTANRVHSKIDSALGTLMKLSISSVVSSSLSTLKQVRSVYFQMEGLRKIRFYQEHSLPIFAWNVMPFQHVPELQMVQLSNQFQAAVECESVEDFQSWCKEARQTFLFYRPEPDVILEWLRLLCAQSPFTGLRPKEEAIHVTVLFDLLAEEFAKMLREKATSAIRPEIGRAIHFIKENLHVDLNLEQLATHVQLSPSYFGHLFKKEIGCSVFDYILEQRIEKAKKYLKSGKYRNYEILDKIGFNNYSYFCSIFRKYVGMSPNEFKHLQSGM